MLSKLVLLPILVIFLGFLILLAVANNHPVPVYLSVFAPQEFGLLTQTISWPLWLIVLCSIGLGILLGMALQWFLYREFRSDKERISQDNKKMKGEVGKLTKEIEEIYKKNVCRS